MINAAALATTPTLTADRIRLVPLEPRHAAAVFASLQDPESNRLTGTHQTFTLEQIERFCATRADQDDRLDFAIEDVETGEYAGGLSVNETDADNESAGFRIDLVAKYQGRGLGPEAIGLILRYLFEEVRVHRVGLEVYSLNERGQRAYEKCGFVLEGRLRDALVWDGQRYDALLMSILRPEWDARNA
ncbi:GNAT family N-acetyltransferase [Jiangella gansuensis]|uniref:GNAT family N-acetyltransferase n=1 Tax=Jiangella gansuensis TaxID=281473 RepID=UPI000479989D|nr:GNAT family protein [Jiangella gansuensis]